MKLRLSIVAAAACLAATSSFAADSLESAFSKGKVKGNLQAWYINDAYTNGSNPVTTGATAKTANQAQKSEYALGGVLGFTTDPYYGINAGVVATNTSLMGQNTNATTTVNGVSGQSTNVGSINYNATTLSEAWVNGSYGKTSLKIGNQALYTPLATSAEGARIFYQTFRAGVLANTDIPDTTLVAAMVTAEQTRTSAYSSSTQTNINQGFQGMSQVAFGSLSNTIAGGGNKPVYAFAAVNSSLKGLTAQVWFYNAVDILNAWYLQADYKMNVMKDLDMYAGVQYINEGGTGASNTFVKNNVASGGIESNFFGAKIGGTYNGFGFQGAYSTTSKIANAFENGSLLTPWGGQTATLFTSSMIANATAGGMQATKFTLDYTFDGVLKGLYAKASYGLYSANGQTTSATLPNLYYAAYTGLTPNVGYSATYGELKYQVNKPFSVQWRIEQDSAVGQIQNSAGQATAPKSQLENRLIAKYEF